MKLIQAGIIVFCCHVFVLSAMASDNRQTADAPESIAEQYVMLYYRDLQEVRDFYANTLGLEATFEDEWVTLYRTTPTSFVGVVREGNGYHRARENNAVMLSIVTKDVDAWNRRLKSAQTPVTFIKEIYNHDKVPIRALLITDPGGYTIEIFQWLNR